MHTIGLDIGGTTIKAGRVGPEGQILETAMHATDTGGIDRLIALLADLVGTLVRNAPVGAVGLGVPGLRSSATGEVVVSPNIPCLAGTRPDVLLADRLGLPVVARNDADMSAWAEFRLGAGRGTRHMICLTLGTGVGSGIILGGALYNGALGYAAEAGHITVDPAGRPCSCGNRGCLEAMASATGIVALARESIPPHPRSAIPEPWTAETLAQAARNHHTGAARVFERAGRSLGIACAGLMNLLNPEIIVLGGGVMAAEDLILPPARQEAQRRAFAATFGACPIVAATLGNRAGIVGAGLLAAELSVPPTR